MDYRSRTTLVARKAMKLVEKVQGPLGIGGTFHVHADEIARGHAGSFRDQAGDQVAGEVFIQIEAHVGKFQADVGMELAGGDFVQQVVGELGAGASLGGVGDVFTEVVDGNAGARLINHVGSAKHVGYLGTGNEAAGKAPTEGRAFAQRAQRSALWKREESRYENGGPSQVR